MPPLVKPLTKDRLAHLFGTGCPDRAFGLEKAQALCFEWQSAMVEQGAHLCFGVVNQGFAEHAVHAASQDVVEMRHQVDIVAVEAAEVFQAVGEILAAGEVLLEAGKATSRLLPPGIDDACIEQDQLDQPDMGKIVRHLAYEERLAEFAVDAGALQVALAESTQSGGVKRRQRLGLGS